MSDANAVPPPTRVLLIEDSDTDALLIESHLKKADAGFEVRRETRLKDGLGLIAPGEVHVVLLDLNLPDSGGLDTFRAIQRRAFQIPIVVLSGHDDEDLALNAVALGAQDYLPKTEANRSSLTRSVRYAIERARRQRAEQELNAAGEIQRRLFPQRAPSVDGFDIFGRCEPADSAGGDYFDFFPMCEDGWGIVIADVSGHGIGPALIMSETRAILRTLARTYDNVGDILTRANCVLSEDLGQNTFVALLLVYLQPATRMIRYASHGHPGIRLNGSGQIINRIRSTDPPLGVVTDRQFETLGEVQLDVGDTLLLYTDGIVEPLDDNEQPFGEQRLVHTVASFAAQSSRATIDEVFARVEQFSSETSHQDDMTAVVIKVTG